MVDCLYIDTLSDMAFHCCRRMRPGHRCARRGRPGWNLAGDHLIIAIADRYARYFAGCFTCSPPRPHTKLFARAEWKVLNAGHRACPSAIQLGASRDRLECCTADHLHIVVQGNVPETGGERAGLPRPGGVIKQAQNACRIGGEIRGLRCAPGCCAGGGSVTAALQICGGVVGHAAKWSTR